MHATSSDPSSGELSQSLGEQISPTEYVTHTSSSSPKSGSSSGPGGSGSSGPAGYGTPDSELAGDNSTEWSDSDDESLDGEDGQQQPSFVASRWAAPPSPTHDGSCYLLLAFFHAASAWKLQGALLPLELGFLIGAASTAAAGLAWLCVAPTSYRYSRTALCALLYLLLSAGQVALDSSRWLSSSQLVQRVLQDGGGAVACCTFVLILLATCVTSPVLVSLASPLLGSLAFQPPPVLAAALYLAGACLAATTAPRVCSSALLTHRITLPWLHSLYRCLEPATVLLEPLLLALGMGRDHPQRRCLNVLYVLYAWLIFLLPTALCWCSCADRYIAWRAASRQQRRAARLAQRSARQVQTESWGFGFIEPSSSGSPDGTASEYASGRSSQTSTAFEDAARALTAALPPQLLQRGLSRLRAGRQRHHPADWQYVLAARVVQACRIYAGNFAIVALLVLPPLYAWHVRAFPYPT